MYITQSYVQAIYITNTRPYRLSFVDLNRKKVSLQNLNLRTKQKLKRFSN